MNVITDIGSFVQRGFSSLLLLLALCMVLASCDTAQTRRRMADIIAEADSMNRHYAPMTSDSLLLLACRYYDRHGTPNERMRAHYLLGCAYRDMGEAPQALECYQDAINNADTTATDCDFRLLARVHGQACSLFATEHLYRNALRESRNVIRCAIIGHDTLTSLLAYGQQGHIYYGLGKTDSTLFIFEQTREKLKEHGYEEHANTYLSAHIYHLLKLNEYQKAKHLLDIYEHQSLLSDTSAFRNADFHLLYYYKGLYYQGIGKTDSAISYFNRLLIPNQTSNNLGLAYQGLYNIYREQGGSDSLSKYADLYVGCLDSIVNYLEQSQLLHVQSLYDYTRHQKVAEAQKLQAERLRFWLVSVISVFIFGFAIIWLVIMLLRNRAQQKLSHISSMYALEIIEYNRLKMELIRQEREQEKTKEEQEALNKELEQARVKLSMMQEDKKIPEQWDMEDALLSSNIVCKFHKMALGLHTIPESDWDQLRTIAYQYLPNFMQVINSLPYQINRRETDLCILLRLRFILSEISILLDMRPNNLSNLRKRLLKRMFGVDGSASDFNEKILSIPR